MIDFEGEYEVVDQLKKDCCNGCKMCADLCPIKAIKYESDKEGFWYPVIDVQLCVACGKCIKCCPNNSQRPSRMESPDVKAAWSKDDDIRMASTSGGLFYELAKELLNNEGYVAGCVYTENFKGAKHVLIHSLEDLPQLMVSKYLQSDTDGIYAQVKAVLNQEKKVLFVGAPCHCAALDAYLERKYDNLILCDFICRGANSPKAHRKYVEYLETQFGARMVSLRSKDKRYGWNHFGQSATFQNGTEYFADRDTDLRIVAYHYGNLMMRPSCHSCKFKSIPRRADITLGDFWGIEAEQVEDMEKGISMVMLNSSKGKALFRAISEKITYLDKTLTDVEKGNPAIYTSAVKGKNRDAFLQELDEIPFDQLVAKYRDRECSKMLRALLKIKQKLRR